MHVFNKSLCCHSTKTAGNSHIYPALHLLRGRRSIDAAMEAPTDAPSTSSSEPLTGMDRLRRFGGYVFAHHDDAEQVCVRVQRELWQNAGVDFRHVCVPCIQSSQHSGGARKTTPFLSSSHRMARSPSIRSSQLPPLPEELGDLASQTSMTTFVGCVVGFMRQFRTERAQPLPTVPSQGISSAARSRAIAELQTQRLARLANSSIRGGLAFGGMCFLYCGSSMLSRVYHDGPGVVDSVLGGLAAGSLLGLPSWGRPAAGAAARLRGVGLGALLGAGIGLPIGWVQEAVRELLPETVGAREEQVRRQTDAIVQGSLPTVAVAAARAAAAMEEEERGGKSLTDAVIDSLEKSFADGRAK